MSNPITHPSTAAHTGVAQEELADLSLARLAASVDTHAADLADLLGGFFAAAGLSRERAADIFRCAADRALAGAQHLRVRVDHTWLQLSDAIVLWWRDPDYVDDSGLPRELPDTGPAPSLDALLARTVDEAHRSEAKDLLRRTVAAEADGIWRYTRHDGVLPVPSGAESVQRLHLSLSGMLSTFIDNQLRFNDPAFLKNVDAAAHIPAFPVQLIPELRSKLQKRMHLLLDDVDVWMTSAAARHAQGPVALVGISTFMYVSEPRACETVEPDRRESDASAFVAT